jgi:hypothetical protein
MQFDLVATRATVDLAERDGKGTFLRTCRGQGGLGGSRPSVASIFPRSVS